MTGRSDETRPVGDDPPAAATSGTVASATVAPAAPLAPASVAPAAENGEDMGEDAAALAALRARLDRRHRAELAAITAELERERGSLSQMLIDQGLASALSRAGVAPALVAGAAALLRPMMAVTGEGTARGLTARLPDGSNRPLASSASMAAAPIWSSTLEPAGARPRRRRRP